MFVPILLACIVAVFGKANHHDGISHGHHHHQTFNHQDPDSHVAPLIVGGSTVTNLEYWPWQATLQSQNFLFCGGSLINPNGNELYVLTAAHCVTGRSPGSFFVDFGRLRNDNNNQHKQTLAVTEITIHENYNRRTLENDVALLKLQGQPTENAYVSPVKLPTTTDEKLAHNTMVWVTGFGTLSSGGSSPTFLQEVEKPYLDDSECMKQSSYGNAFYPDEMLCSGEVGKDACQGDSGGPLVHGVYSQPSTFTLYGVVSWGYGCAEPNYPGVYAEVSHYLNWIKDNAN